MKSKQLSRSGQLVMRERVLYLADFENWKRRVRACDGSSRVPVWDGLETS
jgi:hypothetical protein